MQQMARHFEVRVIAVVVSGCLWAGVDCVSTAEHAHGDCHAVIHVLQYYEMKLTFLLQSYVAWSKKCEGSNALEMKASRNCTIGMISD